MPWPTAGGEMKARWRRTGAFWLAGGAFSLTGISCGVIVGVLTHAPAKADSSTVASGEFAQGGLNSQRPPAEPLGTAAVTSVTTSLAAMPATPPDVRPPGAEPPDSPSVPVPPLAPVPAVQLPAPQPPARTVPPVLPAPAPIPAPTVAPSSAPPARVELPLIPLKPQEPVRPGQLQVG